MTEEELAHIHSMSDDELERYYKQLEDEMSGYENEGKDYYKEEHEYLEEREAERELEKR